jgi:hypothetical protein
MQVTHDVPGQKPWTDAPASGLKWLNWHTGGGKEQRLKSWPRLKFSSGFQLEQRKDDG